MAEVIIASVLKKAITICIAGFSVHERGNLRGSKYYLTRIDSQVEFLRARREDVLSRLEEARRNGEEAKAEVQAWLHRVDKTLDEATELSFKFHRNRGRFLNLMFTYQLIPRAQKIIEDIAEQLERGVFERIAHLPLRTVGFIFDESGNEKLESRKLIKEGIVSALEDSKVNKVGVYGLVGVGKTTLVREIAKEVAENKLFDVVVMAQVSPTLDVEKIQSEIAAQLDLRIHEENGTLARASRLYERIRMEKSILLILDDIWHKIDLRGWGIPSDDNFRGCKILLTSRDKYFLQMNETQENFRLEVLNEVESWNLFQSMVDDSFEAINLRNIADEVVKRCAGLPLLVKTTASILRNRDISYWRDALDDQLQSADDEEMYGMVYSSLTSSCSELKEDEVKVFLLCGLLSGTSILVNDLLKYVIGLDIFQGINSLENARKRLSAVISRLKASCWLLDDDTSAGVIKMYDIVKKFAVSFASKNQDVFILKDSRLQGWPREDFLEKCTQIILVRCYIQKLPARLECTNMKIFLLDSTDNPSLEIPPSFFEGMGNLEVLHLIGMIMPSLPTSLASLIKLKTLSLDQCSLEDMAVIGALNQLEIFSFVQSSMKSFPSEIGPHLRMLDLGGSQIEIIPSNIFYKLNSLEELYMGNNSLKWEVESSAEQNENALLIELRHLTALEIQIREEWILSRAIMFEQLERYKIVIGDKLEWPEKNEASRLLMLKLDNRIHLNDGIKFLVKRAEDLYLEEINGISNVFYQLNDEGFPKLQNLHIQNNTNIQHVASTMGRPHARVLFPKLETLILDNLKNFKKIWHGPHKVDSFEKLKTIKVKSCGELKSLFSASMVKQLYQLLEIEVSECSAMKNIVLLDGVKTTDHEEIEFISLRSLTLQNLSAMNGFCSNDFRTTVPTLFSNAKAALRGSKHLKLNTISRIRHLVTWSLADRVLPLQNLETLEIVDCTDLSYLFVFEGLDFDGIYGELFPELRQLCLSNLGSFRNIVGDNQPGRILNFKMLNHLTVCGCSQLEYLLPLYVLWNLQQLQNINITDCEMLKQVFVDDEDTQTSFLSRSTNEEDTQMTESNETGLPLLQSLKLSNLPQLASFAPGAHHIISRSLTQMTVENCPKFTFTFENHSVNIKEQDPSKEKSEKMIIMPSVLENLNLCQVNHLKTMSKDHLVSFTSLTSLHLYKCDRLEYLFSLSIAHGLSSLQEFKIVSCKKVEQIVIRETEEIATADTVEFPQVNTLILEDLLEFTVFCRDGCSVKWLALNTVRVVRCPKIQKSTLGTVDRPLLKSVKMIGCKPWENEDPENNINYLFKSTDPLSEKEELKIDSDHELNKYLEMELQKSSFRELKTLEASRCDKELNNFLSILLRRSHKLEQLTVEKCELLEQIFDLGDFVADEEGNGKFCFLKTMRLCGLPKLNRIWNKDPSGIVELNNLVKLEIIDCGLRKCPLSTSLLEKLVLLKELKIDSCRIIEEVVEDDTEMQKRSFPNLNNLQLVSLPKFIKFNSGDCNFKFPNLVTLRIANCPNMNAFTAGFLSNHTPTIEGASNYVPNKMDACPKLQTLKLVGLETFKEIWQDWDSNDICELKAVEVDSSSSLRYIFPSSMLPGLEKLETLVVRNCTSLSYVFQLREKDPITTFQELKIVRVRSCSSLESLSLPCLMLTEIDISDCNTLKEIFIDVESFRHLKSIVLENLPVLSSFSTETSELPLLQKLRIVNCPALKTMSNNVPDRADNLDMHSAHVLFADEMNIPPRLHELELSNLPNTQLWNQEPKIPVFRNLNSLKIIRCRSIQKLFSISVAKRLSVLKLLTLYGCENMVQVLKGEGGKSERVFQKLESLILRDLPSLTSFCEDDVDFGELPELRMVRVENIPNMNTFVKQPLETKNLKEVYVTYINKCWLGDLNKTITHLHENQDELKAKVWVTIQSSRGNNLRHYTIAAESSPQRMKRTRSRFKEA